MTTINNNWHHASEQEDGSFIIGDNRISREELEKLKKLQGGSWIIFIQPGSEPTAGAKLVPFDLAK